MLNLFLTPSVMPEHWSFRVESVQPCIFFADTSQGERRRKTHSISFDSCKLIDTTVKLLKLKL